MSAQQVELLHHDDQGDKRAQAADAGTNPMHDFEPYGDIEIILGGNQRRQHQAKREANYEADC